MPITQQQRKEFEDKGFIVIKGFYDRNTVDKLSAWCDRLRKDNSPDCEEAKYYERSPVTGENVLVRIEHVLGDHNPEITTLLLSPRTIECVTALLGEPPVLFKEKINYKLPGCRADKLHQDQAGGWNAYCPFFISMGIAVDEHRRDNAALSFMCSGKYDKDGRRVEAFNRGRPAVQTRKRIRAARSRPRRCDLLRLLCAPRLSPQYKQSKQTHPVSDLQ